MIKIYRDPITKNIVKIEPVLYVEEIHNFDISQNIVIDDKSGNIVLLEDSSQYAKIELQNKRFSDKILGIKETDAEKTIDLAKAEQALLSNKYVVNVTTKNKKNIAVVHSGSISNIEFNSERGDIITDNITIAEGYKDIIESEGLENAMERFKTLS